MDFALNDDQAAIQAAARAFAEAELAPHSARWDEDREFPVETLRAALARAMHDATINQRLTGLGASIPPAAEITPARYTTVIREETETSREAVRIGNIKLE